MKKITVFLLILILVALLTACGAKDDIPEGMQLVRGGEDVGYYFYAPEEWTVSNVGKISAAYASNVDTSSVSYVETEMPEGTVEEYFNESLDEFEFDITLVYENEETTFGNADFAVMYVYDYTYSKNNIKYNFRTKQIFVGYGERFGIFTYTASNSNLSSPDLSQFDFYEEKVKNVIENFKFIDKTGESEKVLYEYDEDGYALVSDPKVAKFSLYLTEDFEVEYSSGIVCASLADGSNITLSKVMGAGVDVGTYLNSRLSALEGITSDITVIEYEKDDGETVSINGQAELGNAKYAASQEYTFVYNGTKYHVYQVCAVTTFTGFVFTYTAQEDNYHEHLDKIMEIAKRIEF